MTLAGISRCAGDLFYWSSSEVGLMKLAAALCGTSSMMPQKRTPIVLERIRGLAGEATGWGASQLGTLHSATSTDVDQAYTHNRIPGYCRETAGAIGLLREAVSTLEVDADGLARSAGRHWSTASALADDLVRTHGLSFRAAHEVVARFVAAHEAAGVADGTVRPDLAEGVLREYTAERIAEILDVREFVEARASAGGTASARRKELAIEAADDLAAHRHAIETRATAIDQARSRLLRDAAALVADHSA
jgi:argininosuccinate lyase